MDDGIDTGPIILLGMVNIDKNDTEDSLLAKINEKEHEVLPRAIELISKDKLLFDGRKVFVKD